MVTNEANQKAKQVVRTIEEAKANYDEGAVGKSFKLYRVVDGDGTEWFTYNASAETALYQVAIDKHNWSVGTAEKAPRGPVDLVAQLRRKLGDEFVNGLSAEQLEKLAPRVPTPPPADQGTVDDIAARTAAVEAQNGAEPAPAESPPEGSAEQPAEEGKTKRGKKGTSRGAR
jgi:hypothetical protein